MPPIVVVPDLDIVSEVSADECVEIDFLMPNGIFIPLKVNFYDSLEIVKRRLWREAEGYPLFNAVGQHQSYSFIYINSSGQKDEVTDEDLSLNDLRPSVRFLKVIQKQSDDPKRTLDRQKNQLIGPRATQIIEAQQASEVADFRSKMQTVGNEATYERNEDPSGWQAFVVKYPIRLTNTGISIYGRDITSEGLVLTVYVEEPAGNQISFMMRESIKSTPNQLISQALNKWATKTGRQGRVPDHYLLKAVGLSDYVYGEHSLEKYKYVNDCIMKNEAPAFLLQHKDSILEKTEIVARPRPSIPARPPTSLMSSQSMKSPTSVWHVLEPFTFKLQYAKNIEIPNGNKVKFYAGLFYGPESLETISTEDMVISDSQCTWNVEMTFKTEVSEIPHMCRLCMALHGRKGKENTLIAWVNVPLFNYKSRLMRGEYKFSMWGRSDHQQQDENFYPMGTVSQNPEDATVIAITVPNFNRAVPIVFPSDKEVLQCASDNMEDPDSLGSPTWHPSNSHLIQLQQILATDSTNTCQLAEQEKELMWLLRYECRDNYPHALPQLLSSVKWYNYKDVAKMQALLQTWRPIPLDCVLSLLDYNFPDKNVRKKAIEWLDETLSDEELSQYMLQLVQSLKFESYLYSELAKFLLDRCLRNQHMGHQLYWLLKSELHDPKVTVQFGLILEMYLKFSRDHIPNICKQQESLSKLCGLNAIAKQKTKNNVKAADRIRPLLMHKTYSEHLTDMYTPLTPLFKVGYLRHEKCNVMDSKKKPLWLHWTNADERGQDILIMYKNGDDLRQDMLTLQMFTIMDNIWRAEDLDLRMNPYQCVATGLKEGMIEVVQNSATIAKIQCKGQSSAFNKTALFEWLKQKNPLEENLLKAVNEFTLSCAGYSVATYILGIGDRHNDNIMLKESGQLFHIDFGHFLGNFKSKFGVKRERVPFILTEHFAYVISKGGTVMEDFTKFQQVCVDAYLIIRRKGPLLIRLFMMMMMAGIPQLTSINDVEYLKETLALHLSEDEAKERFLQKFQEAINSSWTTKVNWWIHLKAH
ncbi:phosphatidylinositol 4,5-bisphosphate 3-kinase catalytic subunit beta isoform-like [Argopecten irradians]|uniref:phosphatidylinositol 4,5-bisphosphate 3-kinase catalytic subunit beta isoform-like n=1 Tax=Argopecten irradians TaxID=31199 RepID=UPI003721B98D